MICGEGIDSLEKIINANEIKLRLIVAERFFHPVSFFFEFISQLNMMLTVDIDYMQIRLEYVEDLPDLRHWRC